MWRRTTFTIDQLVAYSDCSMHIGNKKPSKSVTDSHSVYVPVSQHVARQLRVFVMHTFVSNIPRLRPSLSELAAIVVVISSSSTHVVSRSPSFRTAGIPVEVSLSRPAL